MIHFSEYADGNFNYVPPEEVTEENDVYYDEVFEGNIEKLASAIYKNSYEYHLKRGMPKGTADQMGRWSVADALARSAMRATCDSVEMRTEFLKNMQWNLDFERKSNNETL